MSEVTVKNCDEIDELAMRYAYGNRLSREERSRVEEHLKGCASCSELVFFVQKTMVLARKEPIRFEPPTDPCLATETFIALDEGTLDEETGRKAKLHLLACPSCREVFLKLRTLSEQKVEERVLEYLEAPRLTDAVVRIAKQVKGALKKAQDRILEVVQISGEGRVLEPTLEPARGKMSVGDTAEEQIAIADTVTDAETGSVSSIRITVTADEKANATLRLASDPPQESWTVSLAEADGRILVSAPLATSEILLGSDLPLSAYIATVSTGDRRLACFSIELRS